MTDEQRRWGIDDVPDQTGRVAVVTGGNGGLGLAASRALARAGAHVVVAARDLEKAGTAVEAIEADDPTGSVEVVPLDLADLDSVAVAAAVIGERHPRLDLLVNNAGIMAPPYGETTQGFELQFGVNHLAHVALTACLLPNLVAVPGSRIVTVTPTARLRAGRLLADPRRGPDGYDGWQAYARSKLANHVFALELDRRLRAAGAPTASLSAHPGLVHTDIQNRAAVASPDERMHQAFARLAEQRGAPVDEGVGPILRAATDPTARGGDLYAPSGVIAGPPVRRPTLDRRAVRQGPALWRMSEELTGLTIDVPALVAAER